VGWAAGGSRYAERSRFSGAPLVRHKLLRRAVRGDRQARGGRSSGPSRRRGTDGERARFRARSARSPRLARADRSTRALPRRCRVALVAHSGMATSRELPRALTPRPLPLCALRA
jgi:hypothetical protein